MIFFFIFEKSIGLFNFFSKFHLSIIINFTSIKVTTISSETTALSLPQAPSHRLDLCLQYSDVYHNITLVILSKLQSV